MNAARLEISEALERFDRHVKRSATLQDMQPLADAARSIALPILEQDEALIERIAEALRVQWIGPPDQAARLNARAVLAAFIPPDTP